MKEKIFIPAISAVVAGAVGFFVFGGLFPGLIGLAVGGAAGFGIAAAQNKSKQLQAPESKLDIAYNRINTIAVSIFDKQVSNDLKKVVSSIKKMRLAGEEDADLFIRFQEPLSFDVPKLLELAEMYYKVGGKGLGTPEEKAQLPRIQSQISSYANSFETKCLALKQDTLADKIDLLEAEQEIGDDPDLEDFDRKMES